MDKNLSQFYEEFFMAQNQAVISLKTAREFPNSFGHGHAEGRVDALLEIRELMASCFQFTPNA